MFASFPVIEINRAPVHLMLQDSGFAGYRSIGLPRSGAIDIEALAFGNSLVGNAPGEVGFEWAVSGGSITLHSDASIAFAGAAVHGRIGQRPIANATCIRVSEGTTLEIDRFISGRFAYLCVSPPPAIRIVFGSRSTYAPAQLGGFHGRRLKSGDTIELRAASTSTRTSELHRDAALHTGPLRILRGPQADALDGRLLKHLLESEFTVSRDSDRTGYRLEGPSVDVKGLQQILSEPACEGAIQMPDSGRPIVLMADGPTVGGYNKIAVLSAAHIGRLAQKNPGEKVRFALIEG